MQIHFLCGLFHYFPCSFKSSCVSYLHKPILPFFRLPLPEAQRFDLFSFLFFIWEESVLLKTNKQDDVLRMSPVFQLGLIELIGWGRKNTHLPEACHLSLAITLLMAGSQAQWQRISLLTFPTRSASPNTRWCFWTPFHYV